MLVGRDITDDNRKRALLLHYTGKEASNILRLWLTLEIPIRQRNRSSQTPKKNTEFEIYKFRQAKHEQSETTDTFQTRLRQLSINCEFASVDNEIKSQITQGCFSTRLWRRALPEQRYLDKLLASARALELLKNKRQRWRRGRHLRQTC